MNSFLLSGNIVVPMFLMLVCGWLLRHRHLVNLDGFKQMNALGFYLLLPCSLLNNLIKANDYSCLSPAFIVWVLFCQVIIITVLILLIPRLVKERASCASVIQACFRSNFLTFGLVIAGAFCNSEEVILVTIVAGILIPLYNVGGILILTYYCGGKANWRVIFKTLVKNPFIIACIIGYLITRLPFLLAKPITSTINSIASSAVPVSFLAMGGSIDFSKLRKSSMSIVLGTMMRLVILPMLIIGLSILMGFRGVELLTVTVMMISPTAIATYPLAEKMGADGELAGYLVVFQSVTSIVTIFLWLWGLSAGAFLY